MTDITHATYSFWHGPPVEVSVWVGTTNERGEGAGEWWMQPTPPRNLTFEDMRKVFDTSSQPRQGVWHAAPDVRDAYLNLLTTEQRFIPTEMTNGGYERVQVQYRNVTMVANPAVPHGNMYFMGPTEVSVLTGIDDGHSPADE